MYREKNTNQILPDTELQMKIEANEMGEKMLKIYKFTKSQFKVKRIKYFYK